MDKTTSVTAALQAGKLPSTQQVNNFIDWLNDVGITQVEPSSNTELSSRGRVLAGGVRQTLDAYRTLINNKNADNIVQEAMWHLTEGDLTTTSEAQANKDQAKADIDALRTSLRNVLSVVWDSVSSEGSSLFYDFLSFLRLSLADAAELVEDQAGQAKETLRQVDEEVQKGERDALGRDKQRLEEEKDAKVAWEHGMDTVKGMGSKAIDVTRSTSETVKEQSEKTNIRLQDALNKISERAQNDEQYRNSLDTIFNILQKRLNATMDAAGDPNMTVSKFIADSTPEQHIPKAVDLFRTFIERMANTSLDSFSSQFRTVTSSIMRDPDIKSWFNDSIAYTRRVLAEPGFSQSDDATEQRKQLRSRWRDLQEKDDQWKKNIEQLKREWNKIENGINKDQDVVRVRNAHNNLVRDVGDGLKVAGEEAQSSLEAAMEQATWFWQDLFKVYLPKAMSKMRDIPIPRTEYKDSEVEFVLENLDISSFNFLPSHVYIRNITDVDITTSDSPSTPSRTAIGTLTHIRVQAVQLALDDISFWYLDKTAGPMTPGEFTGLLNLKLPEKGVDLDLKVRMIPATTKGPNSREALKHFHVIEKAEVSISDDVSFEVKDSNHALLTTVFRPIVVSRLRDALSRTLSEQLRFAIDWADGVAFDISKRRQVFEDTGLSGGGSLIAAIWSEIGRLQRESSVQKREFDVRATGTGVIVEQKKVVSNGEGQGSRVEKSQFAMGAEPQILSGEKRGPLGTGSERVADKLERLGQDMGVDTEELAQRMDVDTGNVREGAKEVVGEVGERAKGLVKEAKHQVSTFKNSVDRKVKLEQERPGWKSAAFDF
ncbi:hypothetical protein CC1G_02721 [Coprinopsis cinerea okayama7|uniref:Uncharacterized protein n=1 Tax=Coprinopsis cinerea (strain Okayama-7 / 130 / ATCC MYA-4618 / FGSC 9003) TaxID=240176 RepID=A8PBS3_COPC7|nr:hypothetical protein CC1G_02721 [Coprinopsis cinerea okayama7\|eukprot:XP_001840258.1 hypothetical protein CC1G_02721 [Coprinopsis cinerea okayama7\